MRMARLMLAWLAASTALMAADNIRPLSGVSLPLQNQPASARSAALGGATVALSGDASATAFNPGLLDAMPSARFSLNHNQWLVDTHQEDLAIAFPAGALGSLGASLDYVDYGVFQGRDASGSVTDNYGSSELGLGLGWGRQLQGGFFAGIGVRGLYQSIADSRQFAAAADLGIYWVVPLYDFNFGASYRGLGSSLDGSPQAGGLRLGISKPLNFGSSLGLLILGGFSVESGGADRLQLALESVLYGRLALRGGYSGNMADPMLGGLYGLSLGCGFNLGRFRIDYSFQPYGVLGDSHKLGLEVALPSTASVEARKASDLAASDASLSPKAPASASPAGRPAATPAPSPIAIAPASPVATSTAVPSPMPSPTMTPSLMPTVAPERADASSGKAFKVVFGEDEMDPEESSLRAELQAKPESWVAWRKLADYLFKKKRKPEAIQAYEKALSLHSDPDLEKWFEGYRDKK